MGNLLPAVPCGRDTHDVEPCGDLFLYFLQKKQGDIFYLSPFVIVHRLEGISEGFVCSGLYFKKYDGITVFCDDINLAQEGFVIFRDYSVPFFPEELYCKGFTFTAKGLLHFLRVS